MMICRHWNNNGNENKMITDWVHFCWCFCIFVLAANFFSHLVHTNFLSVWIKFTCSFTSFWSLKLASQYLHVMTHFLQCSTNLSFLLNSLSHLLHEKKLDPWMVNLCLFRSDCLEKVFEHMSHWNSIVEMKMSIIYVLHILWCNR